MLEEDSEKCHPQPPPIERQPGGKNITKSRYLIFLYGNRSQQGTKTFDLYNRTRKEMKYISIVLFWTCDTVMAVNIL